MNTDHLNDRPRRDDLSSPADVPLTEREKRYRTLFGAMDEGFCVVEMTFDEAGKAVDYHFLEFNDAFERMTGIPASAALAGRSARELYPTLEEHWFETYGRVALTGETVRFENGAEAMGKWFEVHAFRIGGEESREVGILFKDVSERRKADLERERLLVEAQASRAFLDLITDSLPVRIGYIGPDMRYRYLNGVYERLFGLGPGEGVGKTVTELAGKDSFAKAEPHLRRALAGETNFQSFWVDYPFGRRRIEVNYIADPAEGGVVVHVADVTERFRMEERLNDARARRDRALENAEVATFDWDAKNNRVYANALLAEFFGISYDDAQGGPIASYFAAIHPEDRARVRATIGDCLAKGGRYETEYRVIGGDGRERSVLARGDAALDKDGGPSRLTGVVLDVTGRLQAAQALREREELFRTVFEQAPDDAILVMDADRTMTAWNPAAERIVGWAAEEAIGQSGDLIFTPEDREAGAPIAETQIAARQGKAEDERWHLRKDGTRFWGIGTMNSLHDESGKVRGFLKVFRDATERYEEAQTLAFLSLLTEAVVDQRDADRILETTERMVGQYLGVSRVTFGEFAEDEDTFTVRSEWGSEVSSVVGTYRLSAFGSKAVETLRGGRTYVVRDAEREVDIDAFEAARAIQALAGVTVPVLKDGKLVALVVVHQTVPRDWTDDEVGLVQQVAGRLAAEIERARAEAALRTSESRFRQLVELSPSTVWFGEIDGRLSYISHDFYEATGLTPEKALPNGWIATVHPDDLGRMSADWEKARRDETLYDTEFRIRHRDGVYRWISARALPVRDADGRVTGWLGSNSDIQERKTAEATLQARVDERTQELQASVREAEGFNYSISHDLRTPLRAIVSTASILLEELGEDLEEDHRALLVRQAENANRLGRLIDELLRLSRLSRVEVNRQPLDISGKAVTVFDELREHEQTNGCRLEVQPGMTAQGDPGLVRTVFFNLLGNACKFSPNGGTVRVGREGEAFFVSDEGVGFDMRFAPKIFKPFERLVSEAEFPGTGIGLANVERIVRRHGGRVWVESEPERGTTFRFTLD